LRKAGNGFSLLSCIHLTKRIKCARVAASARATQSNKLLTPGNRSIPVAHPAGGTQLM